MSVSYNVANFAKDRIYEQDNVGVDDFLADGQNLQDYEQDNIKQWR